MRAGEQRRRGRPRPRRRRARTPARCPSKASGMASAMTRKPAMPPSSSERAARRGPARPRWSARRSRRTSTRSRRASAPPASTPRSVGSVRPARSVSCVIVKTKTRSKNSSSVLTRLATARDSTTGRENFPPDPFALYTLGSRPGAKGAPAGMDAAQGAGMRIEMRTASAFGMPRRAGIALSALLAVMACVPLTSARAGDFSGSYASQKAVYGSRDCTDTAPFAGTEPDRAGRFPVFVYLQPPVVRYAGSRPGRSSTPLRARASWRPASSTRSGRTTRRASTATRGASSTAGPPGAR